MAPAPRVGWAFFPLDEQLGLDAAGLTPRGQEVLVRLARWLSFERAAQLLQDILDIQVSGTSSRRISYQAGQALLEIEQAAEERIRKDQPEAVQGADRQALSADGAMVPLVGGVWAEVKTVVVAEVEADHQGEIRTTHVSSFSRLTDAESFGQQALVELHRRGVERASAVCAVQDGAEWLQQFVDLHRPDAVRILDFAHAAEHVSDIGRLAREAGSQLKEEWLEEQLHTLKQEDPSLVLAEVERLQAAHPSNSEINEALTYLQKREAQIQSPAFQAAGWPIGSGMVESANKLVVEARLTGAGMHWSRPHVNPMLALRNTVCNQRWHDSWQAAVTHRRKVPISARVARSQLRLTHACWTLALLAARLHLLSRPPAPAPTTASTPTHPPPPRPRYSWKRPFLRLPPSPAPVPDAVHAKI